MDLIAQRFVAAVKNSMRNDCLLHLGESIFICDESSSKPLATSRAMVENCPSSFKKGEEMCVIAVVGKMVHRCELHTIQFETTLDKACLRPRYKLLDPVAHLLEHQDRIELIDCSE